MDLRPTGHEEKEAKRGARDMTHSDCAEAWTARVAKPETKTEEVGDVISVVTGIMPCILWLRGSTKKRHRQVIVRCIYMNLGKCPLLI